MTKSNHHARADRDGDVTYTLDHAKVTFGHGVSTPSKGDEVKVLGKISEVAKKCGETRDAGRVKVRKVEVERQDSGKRK